MTTTPVDALEAERGHNFFAADDVMTRIPQLYATDLVGTRDKIVHLHYFAGSSDWWVVEYGSVTGLAFGFACLAGDNQNSEWGYISLVELASIYRYPEQRGAAFVPPVIVERDLQWSPVPAREVPGIKTWGE